MITLAITTVHLYTSMLEFVFSRAEMARLIEECECDDDSNVIIRLSFSPGKDKVFPAHVIAFCENSLGETIGDDEIDGCPRPPGCG